MPTGKHIPSLLSISRLIGVALFLSCCFALAQQGWAAATSPIKIAVLPCTSIDKTFAKHLPLQAYLQHHLQRQIEIVVPYSLQEFKRSIQLGEVDFAFQPPHAFLSLSDHYQTDSLLKALTPQGASSHRGVIVTRKGSGIKTIADLHGKRFLFGHPFSTAKWVAPRSLLLENDIDPEKDLQDYTHSDSCESIAIKVYLGQGDAGAICDYSLEELAENSSPREDEVPPDALTVIGTTWEVPTWVFAARRGVAPETTAQITDALLNLDRRTPGHAEIMDKLETGGFVRATIEDYNKLRKHLTGKELPTQ